jgi:hypothetical protein
MDAFSLSYVHEPGGACVNKLTADRRELYIPEI